MWKRVKEHFEWEVYGELYAGLAVILGLVIFASQVLK